MRTSDRYTRLLCICLLALGVLCIDPCYSQVIGAPIYDSTGHIEYIPGNLPIVLSASHGGYRTPDSIPDRDCAGCVYLRDSYTQELTRSLMDSLYKATGCFPHVVINLLHRRKLDANRDIGDAADGNPTAEMAWRAFHRFLDSSKAEVVRKYESGLFLDLHGHAHDIQRLELGYLLSRSDLQSSDSVLNNQARLEKSSIKHLVSENLMGLNHAELLRGNYSFGTLMEDQNIPAVPSLQDPSPIGMEPYFSGGYNTARHGSRNGGTIDGIQIECPQDQRFNDNNRELLAGRLSDAIISFIDLHYDSEFNGRFCDISISNTSAPLDNQISVFPNPVNSILNIKHIEHCTLSIFSITGHRVYFGQSETGSVDVSSLSRGFYTIHLYCEDRPPTVLSFVKS